VLFAEMSKVRHATAVAKLPQVIEYLHTALDDSEDKIVVMAHHHDVVNAIAREFGDLAVVLTGETNDRQTPVDRFQNDPGCRLFIGSIRAAGVGITLTAASHVVFAELDWTPGNISQAEDRCHRIGQRESVLVQHLVLDGSLDARMAKVVVDKQEVIDQALDRNVSLPAYEDVEAKLPKVTEVPDEVPAAERQEILAKLRFLSQRCDGARAVDGQGFNGFDSPVGKSLAGRGDLTAKQAALGKKLLVKYRRQLEAFH
jgi:hypothetical protein